METKINAFLLGDWVKIVGHSMLTGCVGFVLKRDKYEDHYRVLVTRDSNGNKTRGAIWVDESQLVLYGTCHEEDDLLFLIDVALDMKDEEWFKELTEQLPLANF